jgi:hypothetical protein
MRGHPDHCGNRERCVGRRPEFECFPLSLQNADRRETLGHFRTRETSA